MLLCHCSSLVRCDLGQKEEATRALCHTVPSALQETEPGTGPKPSSLSPIPSPHGNGNSLLFQNGLPTTDASFLPLCGAAHTHPRGVISTRLNRFPVTCRLRLNQIFGGCPYVRRNVASLLRRQDLNPGKLAVGSWGYGTVMGSTKEERHCALTLNTRA